MESGLLTRTNKWSGMRVVLQSLGLPSAWFGRHAGVLGLLRFSYWGCDRRLKKQSDTRVKSVARGWVNVTSIHF